MGSGSAGSEGHCPHADLLLAWSTPLVWPEGGRCWLQLFDGQSVFFVGANRLQSQMDSKQKNIHVKTCSFSFGVH